MKKNLLIVTVFASSFSLNAQLTEANHAPVAGDTYQTWQCDSVAPGGSGANTVWNFSAINTHSSVMLSHAAAASTNTTYAAATVSVGSTPTSVASFFSSNTSSLSYYGGNISVGSGITAVVATLNYTAPAIQASYPMNLNSTGSAAISGSLSITSPLATSGTFTGSSNVIADGTGTVILPGANGTFTNVTRVVSSQIVNFTTSLSSGTLTQVVYQYYMAGTKAYILSISTATATTPFGSATQTLVLRNKNAVGISTGTVPTNTTSINQADASPLINLSVFPNPATADVNFVTTHPDAAAVLIYDITGKLVENAGLNQGRLSLNISSYNKGLYIYTLVGNNGKKLKSGKLTVSE